MVRSLTNTVVIAASAGIVACAVVYPRWVPEGSPAYRDGYYDGCRSGALARWGAPGHVEHKEKKEYRHDPDYRRGWDEARTFCEQNPIIAPYSRTPGEPGGSTMGDGLPSGK